MVSDADLLSEINAKLSALLALDIERTLIEKGVQRRTRPRSLDKLLSDVGLGNKQIAAVLGKTERAVQMALAEERGKKPNRAEVPEVDK